MSLFDPDPKRNFLVFWERNDSQWSVLAAGYDGEQEIPAVWVFGVDSEKEAIKKALGDRYSMTADEGYTAFALSQDQIINMPTFYLRFKQRVEHDFFMEQS